jgi:hypothetical protein
MIAASGVIELRDAGHGRNCWVFQDDGASPYREKTTKQFLGFLCLALSSDLHWLANSPDRNVSENLWVILKRGMAIQDSGMVDELWEEVRKAWNNIPSGQINGFVESFDFRIQGAMVLHGKSGNGQGSVREMLADGHTLEEISALRGEEKAIRGRFIRDSPIFFPARGWNELSCTDFIRESFPIV